MTRRYGPKPPKRAKIDAIRAARLCGTVAHNSDLPRSHVAEYLVRNSLEDGLEEVAHAWLEAWDAAAEVKRRR